MVAGAAHSSAHSCPRGSGSRKRLSNDALLASSLSALGRQSMIGSTRFRMGLSPAPFLFPGNALTGAPGVSSLVSWVVC